MDNKLEFITNLKKLFNEYNIFNCFNTPEFMADELSEKLQIIIDDYKKKEAIASDDIQEIVKETIENIVNNQINYNKYAFSQYSYMTQRIVKGPILLEGETSLNKRITRLKNVYEIYRDNITNEQLIVLRFADDIVITITIHPEKPKIIRYYKNNQEYHNLNDRELLKINYLKLLENEPMILNNDILIKGIVKAPILEEGVIACNGRIIRSNDQKAEIYFDRKTKEYITVTRMGNQVIIEYEDNGIKKFDRLFINGVELTIEEYMDLVILNDIPNIFPKHYKNITEEGFGNTELIERLQDEPLLDIGCQTYQGRIYRAIAQEEKYIDLITSETLRVIRNKKDNDNYVTIIKDEKEKTEYINNGKKGSYQKVKQ